MKTKYYVFASIMKNSQMNLTIYDHELSIIALIYYYRTMLIRKINNIKGERLRIGNLAVDPHGEFVCLYEQERC